MIIQNAYNKWSATYDTDFNLTRDLDHHVTKQSLKEIHCGTILELGCGTGKNTSFLSKICDKMWAVDFSEGMLSKAKGKSDSQNVTFSQTDITKPWPFEAQSFDLIVCNLVLEHINDLTFIFAEAKRTLKQNGIVFICELHPFRQYQGKKARFERGQETIEIHAFVHNVSDFFSAAAQNNFKLIDIGEWKHATDKTMIPRLLSFKFEK
ncbi:MAG: class I SAM-dependent methyltransferase [Methanococcaceae archaeon]